MPQVTKLTTGNPYEEKESYSRLIMIDDLILMSNTAGRHPVTKIMPEDAAGQAAQSFANIDAVLKSVGSSLADVIRSRVTIANTEDVPEVVKVIAETFRGVEPVSTLTCAALGLPHLKVEVEVTAYKGVAGTEQKRIAITLA